MFAPIRRFFAPHPGSRRWRINWGEAGRAALLGCGATSGDALYQAVLKAIADHADAITEDAVLHALIVGVCFGAMDVLRRLRHGEPEPAPNP